MTARHNTNQYTPTAAVASVKAKRASAPHIAHQLAAQAVFANQPVLQRG